MHIPVEVSLMVKRTAGIPNRPQDGTEVKFQLDLLKKIGLSGFAVGLDQPVVFARRIVTL